MNQDDLFCKDLPSVPLPGIGKVLVTGATGYVGGRLILELLARGYQVRAMVRVDSPEHVLRWPKAEIKAADALNKDSLNAALEGIDTAYYLIHSLQLGPKRFEAADIQAARNFQEVAKRQNVKRIIYLGGLGDIKGKLSSHLRNRIEVADELKRGSASVTELRAAVIIGSGSASYEIIHNLVKNLSIILVPRWAKNKCEPIAIRDVIKYLVGVLETPQTLGKSYHIGGGSVLTYERMLKVVARIQHKRVIFIPCFISNIRIYAYCANFFTPVPAPIVECLLDGLRNEAVCQESSIKELLPFKNLSYRKAMIRAFSSETREQVLTRWSDAYPFAHELSTRLVDMEGPVFFIKECSIFSDKDSHALFKTICEIGGELGWFNLNWMWRLRGMLDRILSGVGTQRGRKKNDDLGINDVIDFWRIEDLQKNKRLLLRAEMKLPGKAWLEFRVEDQGEKRKLTTIAHFDTQSFWGKVYWYACVPFHYFIFERLLQDVEKRS